MSGDSFGGLWLPHLLIPGLPALTSVQHDPLSILGRGGDRTTVMHRLLHGFRHVSARTSHIPYGVVRV